MTKKDKLVVKANELIESKYKLTSREQKIVLFLISQIKQEDEEFKTYNFPIKKFTEMIGLKNPNYNEILDITEQLQRKVLRIKVDNGTKKGIASVAWLSFAFHNQSEGTIDIRFDPFLKPYLLQLRNRFTSYELRNIVGLRRSYSIRLYELLKQYENLKERIIELDEFRELLGIENKYTSYGNIKQKILEPSKKELKEKTDINFNYEEIKEGRKIGKIKFIIYPQLKKSLTDPQPQLSIFDDDLKAIDYPLYNHINEFTEKRGYAVDIKTIRRWEDLAQKKWKNDSINKLLFLIDETNQKDEIDNPIGFITYILKQKEENEFREEVNNSKINQHNSLKEIKALFKDNQEMTPVFLAKSKVINYLIDNYQYDKIKANDFFTTYENEIMNTIEAFAKKNKSKLRKKKTPLH